MWTEKPGKNYHLLICLAILDTEKNTLIENNFGFTEILKVRFCVHSLFTHFVWDTMKEYCPIDTVQGLTPDWKVRENLQKWSVQDWKVRENLQK